MQIDTPNDQPTTEIDESLYSRQLYAQKHALKVQMIAGANKTTDTFLGMRP